jgi:hypothetical protein
VAADGCEVNLLVSEINCGSCGLVCSLFKANNACNSGVCTLASCVGGYDNCNGKVLDGCEVSLQEDANHCGACGTVCTFPNAVAACKAGACEPSGCTEPWKDCNAEPQDGCESNKNTDAKNCGSCGHECVLANATSLCTMGVCGILACNPGYADCNNDPVDGCELHLDADPLHCGSCTTQCNNNNGTAGCALGACTIACKTDFANCDGSLDNGCEVFVKSNVDHCSACGNKCTAPNGVPNCVNGVCGVSQCVAPNADCDGDTSNGCEVNVTGDVNNCSGCGKACYVSHGTPACTGGVCNILSCAAGWADCNASYPDGCEAALDTLLNCGQCGNDCILPNAKTSCATQTCQIASCLTPYANCDGQAANGCEVDTSASVSHCGGCGNACSSTHGQPLCQGGTCTIVCAADWGNCNATPSDGCETALTNNVSHCGACGAACAVQNGQPACNGKTCAVQTCTSPWADCDLQYSTGCETNTSTSVSNCGGCGQVCNSTNGAPSCAGGACAIACFAGFGNCDSEPANGCETNLKNDAQNCNACGAACNFANAIGMCVNSACVLGACLPGFGDCDNNPANGCETNLKSAAANCGACGTVCKFTNAVPRCTNGSCGIDTCLEPFADCDGQLQNGCETNTATDINNCALCGKVCNSQNGTASCTNKVCGLSCNAGFADCDLQQANGCEVNTSADVLNCNTCGNVCPAPSGTPNCVGGVCGIANCAPGTGDCDGNINNGCETNLSTSVANCKTCGNACLVANGTAACVGSACQVAACNADWMNCNGLYSDGCETNLKTTTNCGGCGLPCSLANATSTCATGTCLVQSCNAGFGDCDAVASTGCEASLASTTNCGVCGMACTNANGTTACTSGSCVPTCAAGYANCDGNPANGCETSTQSSVSNCGACGTVCGNPHGTTSCVAGTCVPVCASGYGNCDGNQLNGCEANLNTDLSHCGSCPNACTNPNGSTACTAGACAPVCNTGWGNCNGNPNDGCETGTLANLNNCGTCGNVCSSVGGTPSCSAGTCSIACASGFGNCDALVSTGCEANLSNDVNHCGSCTTTCTNAHGATACVASVCTPTCSANWGNCDGNANNGCEASLTTLTSCGACGAGCARTNATASCATGSCQIASCTSGYGNCDGIDANGCEASLSSTSHCGGCGVACANPNGTTVCSGGACVPTCTAGYGNCDGNANNGCETNLNTDALHCGSCPNACAFANASASCVAGACQLGTCNAGWGNCDGNAANGCETPLNTTGNCGACGTTCTNEHGATSCTGGVCVPTCASLWGNCDGNPNNGCEQTLSTLTSCGGCGAVCIRPNATATCSTGTCQIASCNTGYGSCDGIDSNGCEANTQSSLSNCGTCGTVCSANGGNPTCALGACSIVCSTNWGNCDGNAQSNGCESNLLTDPNHCGNCTTVCSGSTPACDNGTCSGSGPTVHSNGLGQTYIDPHPLGQPGVCGTYTVEMATAAAQASTLGGVLGTMTCDSGATNCITNVATKACAIWCYESTSNCMRVGRVNHNPVGKTCFCPGTGEATWN